MQLPAGKHVAQLLRHQKRLLARFAATSLGRTALLMASVFLIQEFLVGVPGGQQGLARSLAAGVPQPLERLRRLHAEGEPWLPTGAQ